MKIKSMAEISLFAVLSAVGARIMIPVPFVPFTLQTLVCMLAGFALGARKGAASQLLYMLMGLVGIPRIHLGGRGPRRSSCPRSATSLASSAARGSAALSLSGCAHGTASPASRVTSRRPARRRGHIRRGRRISIRDPQLLGSAGRSDLLQGAFDRIPQHGGRRRREGRGRRDCGGETVARWDWKIKHGALRKLRV